MTVSEILNIVLMQGFAGLSLFSVLLLMGLGLAIIFGQMGVINMAHGEFMTIGAYTIFMFSRLCELYAPWFTDLFFPVAIITAFFLAFAVGWALEYLVIRHLYHRPLDTLLATWGVSLGMQQSELGKLIMYTLGALLLAAVLLGAVTTVVDSVLGTIGLSAIIKKIPIIGSNWNLLVAIGMMAVIDINLISAWGLGMTDKWMVYVANGAIVYGMVPLKDAVVSMVGKGLRA